MLRGIHAERNIVGLASLNTFNYKFFLPFQINVSLRKWFEELVGLVGPL